MSGRFGLKNNETSPERESETPDLSARLRTFPMGGSEPLPTINFAEVDAAGERRGFVSREASSPVANSTPPGHAEPLPNLQERPRKRRRIETEPTRDLSFCMGYTEFDRFVAFADRHKLTYRQAVVRLLDIAANRA